MIGRLAGLVRALGRRRPKSVQARFPDIEDVSRSQRPSTPIEALVSQIHADAIAIYVRHALPTRRGHYARTPRSRRWKFVARSLSAEERWALLQANPPERGWKFGTLADIGADPSGPPDVQAAAALLAGTTNLKRRLKGFDSVSLAEDMEAAIRLGSAWRALQDMRLDEPVPEPQTAVIAPLLTAPIEDPAPAPSPRKRRRKPKPA